MSLLQGNIRRTRLGAFVVFGLVFSLVTCTTRAQSLPGANSDKVSAASPSHTEEQDQRLKSLEDRLQSLEDEIATLKDDLRAARAPDNRPGEPRLVLASASVPAPGEPATLPASPQPQAPTPVQGEQPAPSQLPNY